MNRTALPRLACPFNQSLDSEELKIYNLRKISYGAIMPIICLCGIVGNSLNLVVLTRRNMQGMAYAYMRGYSLASLLALLFCIPFASRILGSQDENGYWTSWPRAFYHAHLELYLGNSCLGIAVSMLSALTVERHARLCCEPPQAGAAASTRRCNKNASPLTRPVSSRLLLACLPLATLILHLPLVFRARVDSCYFANDADAYAAATLYYWKNDNLSSRQLNYFQLYRVVLEIAYKLAPTVLIVSMNLRIFLVYKRAYERRLKLTVRGAKSAENRRLGLFLGTTSLLFLVCVSPMAILQVTLNKHNLLCFPYQVLVFRATANLLEVANYALSFYINCLFSRDFRDTLVRTLKSCHRVQQT
ncbi:unnamed protein product [Trichogramma brassicae]|uniref:G-protein coupled receptors family 1 profile domain-containing protein n=1 Tax=Trichogramma brassicae TaxID=86971 RepID=A0A6H5JA24_9HYME|nr:unnamed protein product [Trichogramma brassicae]